MNLYKYNNFLLESQLAQLILEAEVKYFQDFIDVLDRIKSPIAEELIKLIGKDLKITTNFLGLGDKEDEVTFFSTNIKHNKYQIMDPGHTFPHYTDLFKERGLEGEHYPSLRQFTTGKVVHIFEPSDPINRTGKRIAHFVSDEGENCFIWIESLREIPDGNPQRSSIGRISRRMLDVVGKKFTDVELQEFVNEFKFIVSVKNNRSKLFELVDGEKIRYYYLSDRYDFTKEGTLHGSCMRYRKCQKYFKIYTENPQVCKLLILKSPYNPGLIIGRALVWTLDDGGIFMDRIYYSCESDINLFKDYAIKNGWCYKAKQESSHHSRIEFSPEKVREGDLTVKLEKYWFDDYPYMDTLKFLNERAQIISTNDYRSDLTLQSTDGGRGECDTCNGDGRVDCPECDGDERVECGRCDGDGSVECNNCDGNGEVDCSNCDGDGKIEEDGEEVECPDCSGKGKEECSDCDGDGENECSRCDGDGRVECDNCGGEGRVDCPDC
jgi:hypothetical protein